MTIQKLSPGISIEKYCEYKLEDKPWCYAAVILSEPVENDQWGLGITVADDPGYHPISGYHARASTFEEMMDYADDLNLQRGINRAKSAMIIASTMGGLPRSIPERRRA